MKGVGRVAGWRIYDRGKNDIWWVNDKVGKDVFLWREGDKWKVMFSDRKTNRSRSFAFKNKQEALKRIRNYMLKHSGSSKKSKKKSTSKRKSTKKREKKSSHRRSYGWLVWR